MTYFFDKLHSFCFICRQHKEEVSGDIFDMLLTFTDFLAFKEMFLAYRTVSLSINNYLLLSFEYLPVPIPYFGNRLIKS